MLKLWICIWRCASAKHVVLFYPYCKLCNKVWNYFHEWTQKQTFWIRFFFFSSPFKGMNQNDGKKLPIDLRIFDVITEIQTGWQKRLCKKRSNRYIGKIVSVPHCIFCFTFETNCCTFFLFVRFADVCYFRFIALQTWFQVQL